MYYGPEFIPPPPPAGGRPLREVVLAALALAWLASAEPPGHCDDCARLGRCADHRQALAAAAEFERAYARVAGYGTDGAVLHALGGLA